MAFNLSDIVTKGPQLAWQAATSPVDAARNAASCVADVADRASNVAHEMADEDDPVMNKVADVADQISEAAHGWADSNAGDMVGEAAKQAPGGGPIGSAIQALTGSSGGGSGDGGYAKKMRNIIKEAQDVAVPYGVAYNQWTQFEDLPTIFKAVESVEVEDEINSTWTFKIGPSRRESRVEITEQVPDSHIAWKSVGGAQQLGVISFHEIDRALSRVQLEMEYYPQGFIEKIGNLFLAPRKRARRELRLFKHHMELEREETGAWRGEIRDSEVVTTHEENEQAEREAQEAEDAQAEDDEQQQASDEQSDSQGDDEQSGGQGDDEQADQPDAERVGNGPSRRELYEIAKELDIEGRSKMAMDELQEAVSEAVSAE
jgi:uncharacterized membrane protein